MNRRGIRSRLEIGFLTGIGFLVEFVFLDRVGFLDVLVRAGFLG